jgi:uncharacterized damage-inducible protein DinB
MSSRVQNNLTDLLKESHSATRTLLEGVDPEIRVYKNTDWRIRDIIGHIATWDREVTKSLNAFRLGEEYFIPDLEEDEFNEQAVLERKKMTYQQILVEWEKAREDFIEAIQKIPLEQFQGEMLYPWGDERGSIQVLVEYMVEHDEEHRAEMKEAIKATKVD